jgi:hypothetical protein
MEINDVRIQFLARCVVDAQPLGNAGPEVVVHDVRLRDQRVHNSKRRRTLQVQRDALLPLRRGEGEQAADEVTAGLAAKRFDGDHAGAQLRQERRRVGAGEPGGEIDDGQAGKRPLPVR